MSLIQVPFSRRNDPEYQEIVRRCLRGGFLTFNNCMRRYLSSSSFVSSVSPPYMIPSQKPNRPRTPLPEEMLTTLKKKMPNGQVSVPQVNISEEDDLRRRGRGQTDWASWGVGIAGGVIVGLIVILILKR